MILTWTVGTVVIGVLMAFAAFLADRAAGLFNAPRRWIWAFALGAATLWPIGAGELATWRAAHPNPVPIIVTTLSPVRVISTTLAIKPAWWENMGTIAAWAWALISLLLVARIIAGLVRIELVARDGEHHLLDGVPVVVTDSVGPAVCGVARTAIVVPRWLLDLDEPLRGTVLRHEREHILARDSAMVLGGALAAALVPWSPAVWWMARRLRLAVELDCDRRVLRAEAEPERYGHLLMLVAQRQAHARLMPMLAESNAHLERRIRAMHGTIGTRSPVRGALLGALALGVVIVACTSPVARDVTSPQPISASRLAGVTPQKNESGVYFEYQVEKAVTKAPNTMYPRYPDILKTAGVEGEVLAQFVVDTNGRIDSSTVKVLKSTHQLFTNAVVNATPGMRFTPALIGGKPVKQLVQEPFVFALAQNDIKAAATKSPAKPVALSAAQGKVAPVTAPPARPTGAQAKAALDTQPYFEFVVQKPIAQAEQQQQQYKEFTIQNAAKEAPNTQRPRYPDILKSAGVEGMVLAQVVVLDDGTVMPGSLKIVKSSHELFSQAVANAVPGMRFVPAEVDGRKVRQLVQLPFVFAVAGSGFDSTRHFLPNEDPTKKPAGINQIPTVVITVSRP